MVRQLDLPEIHDTHDEITQKRDDIKLKIKELEKQLDTVEQEIRQSDCVNCIHEFDPAWRVCRKCDISLEEFHYFCKSYYNNWKT